MKLSLSVSVAVASLATAAPTALAPRQTQSCSKVAFVFARGTGEPNGPSNLGAIVGPGVSAGLQSHYGSNNVNSTGVNYQAEVFGNFAAAGCDATGISTFAANLQQLATACPDTKIVAGGYSQGAACLHGAFRALDNDTISHISGVVTFGDTRKEQDGGQVPNFPASKTKIFCAVGDGVCDGTLAVDAAHLTYGDDAAAAVSFLTGLIGSD